MSIPDYQTLMLPVLKTAGDNEEHRIGDVVERLARDFGLSDDERRQLLPSGKQSTFSNRVHWAKSYLVQAGLLKATKRGHFQITDRGRTVLTKGVARIDAEYLAQFPEFIQFRERNRIATGAPNETVAEVGIVPAQVQTQTPDEILRATVRQIETALRKEILDRILAAPPAFFEGLIPGVVELDPSRCHGPPRAGHPSDSNSACQVRCKLLFPFIHLMWITWAARSWRAVTRCGESSQHLWRLVLSSISFWRWGMGDHGKAQDKLLESRAMAVSTELSTKMLWGLIASTSKPSAIQWPMP